MNTFFSLFAFEIEKELSEEELAAKHEANIAELKAKLKGFVVEEEPRKRAA